MAKQSDEDYDKIMADLKARLDQIEIKPKPQRASDDTVASIIVLFVCIVGLLAMGALIYMGVR